MKCDPAAIRELVCAAPFPDPAKADADGLLAHGGDLRPERLISAYAQGIFPWYDSSPILWFSPDPRSVLPLSEFRINRTLRKNLQRERYEVRVDSDFETVIRSCAAVERPDQLGTWITTEMIEAYCQLHALGFAHSVEAWQEGELMGGIYGLSLGAAFFGESMFARRSDASKVALAHLVSQLARWDFHFLDCQVYTENMERFGARPWRRADFLKALALALEVPTRRGPWRFTNAPPG